MAEEQFSPEEQALIQRLERAPQFDLSSTAFEAIRSQILEAVDLPAAAPQAASTLSLPVLPTAIALVVIVVIIIIVIILPGQPQAGIIDSTATIAPSETTIFTETPSPSLTATAIPTDLPTQTATVITETTIFTETPSPSLTATATPTDLPTQVATVTPTGVPTQTATVITETPQPTTTPTSTATPVSSQVIIIIEGPIQRINLNIITVYDIDIEVAPDDPILTIIRIGDRIRVEGVYPDDNSIEIIIAIRIIYIDLDVNVSPEGDEVWRDDGTCGNPPPDWASADGWRQRCQGNQGGNNQGGGNQGTDTDNDDDDDNDGD